MNPYVQYSKGEKTQLLSPVAAEESVGLTVNGDLWLGFQCTPVDLDLLAVGFLYNEACLNTVEEIENVHVCNQNDNVDIWLNHPIEKPATWFRASGCHGGITFSKPLPVIPQKTGNPISASDLLSQIDQFLKMLIDKDHSHGIHTTALCQQNEIIYTVQDIGRHNTLDKVAGYCLLNGLNLEQPVIVITGRISTDMVYKAARMRIPIIISLHSTTDLAIKAAEKLGLTLICHARRGMINVFSHPERIDFQIENALCSVIG